MGTNKKIPFFGLNREVAVHRETYLNIIEKVFSHSKFLQGDEVKQFEENVANLCGRRYGVATNSCTDALYYSLVAAGIEPGDEVLVTDFSFVPSASCIVRLGAKPVFVDIDDHFLMDLDKAALSLNNKTRAIIFVHLFGQMGNPKEIENFARLHDLILIEDAAQVFGASYNGIRAGSTGLLSCLSFDPTKVISAPGSGGMVLTDDENLAQEIARLRYHGKNEKGEFVSLGFNSQMPSLTAAILDYKLGQNEKWLAIRRDIAKYYLENVVGEYILPFEIEGSCHIYHKFVIRSQNRDHLRLFFR